MSKVSRALAILAPRLESLKVQRSLERASVVMERVLWLLQPWGFEVRLAPSEDRVDFGGAISFDSSARRSLAALEQLGDERRDFAASPPWQALRLFAACWGDPLAGLARAVPFIGFEFDIESEPSGVPVPSVFAMLDWPIGGETAGDQATLPKRRGGQRAAQSTLRLLLGEAYPPAVTERVDECFRALPADGRIISVGAMLGRRAHAVRIFACLPPADAAPYLASIGWPGDANAFDAVWRRYERHLSHGVVQVQADVGMRTGDRLGIEFSFMRQAHAAERWRGLVDQLVEERLCSVAKHEALLDWPGQVRSSVDDGGATFDLDISHVKLSLCGGVVTEAKAYLAVDPRTGA
jgi:hypothetical protein